MLISVLLVEIVTKKRNCSTPHNTSSSNLNLVLTLNYRKMFQLYSNNAVTISEHSKKIKPFMDHRLLTSNIFFFNSKEVQNTTEKSFYNTRLKNSLTSKIIFETWFKKDITFFLFFMKNILEKRDERIIKHTRWYVICTLQ